MALVNAFPAPSSQRQGPDPLGPVWRLGQNAARVGAGLGLLGALALHGAAGVQAAANLFETEGFAAAVSQYVKNGLQLQIDIDTPPPPPPPPPPAEAPPTPEPEPEKAPPPQATPPAPNEPPPPPAPAPAEAGKVLTSDPDPDAPVDLTGDGFVTGNGEFRGGITSSAGTAKTAVRDVKAQPSGVPAGTGTAPAAAPKAAPDKDLSRAAAPVSLNWQDCGFPAEAQLDGVEFGIVKLVVNVGNDGRAKSVSILKDPGSGFGNHARQCAMRRLYNPALDKNGQPVASSTPPITVKFTL